MRVALISDLHANELALDAVLADAKRAGVDRIVCLGDVATMGPRPREVLARLADLGCLCILGNHDEFMLDEKLIRSYTEAPVVVDAVDWTRAQLSQREIDFVRGFSRRETIPLDGDATLLVFHGSPRSHMEDLLATTPAEALEEALSGHSATVMSGGHTHLQMLRQHRGTLLCNPGSVGMPFREYAFGRAPTILAHAEYAIVDGEKGGVRVDLRRVSLDRRALHDAAKSCAGNPISPSLAEQYS